MDLDDQMESVKANINYLHDNILECQQNILQMEQAAGSFFYMRGIRDLSRVA